MHRRSKESPKVTEGVRDEADTMKDDSGGWKQRDSSDVERHPVSTSDWCNSKDKSINQSNRMYIAPYNSHTVRKVLGRLKHNKSKTCKTS